VQRSWSAGVLAGWSAAVPAAMKREASEPPGEDATFFLYIHGGTPAHQLLQATVFA
jgi:hypothetical protein